MKYDEAPARLFDRLRKVYPFVLLLAYGVFMCGYFFFQDYNDHYRYFARFLFVISIVVIIKNIPAVWRHPVFLAATAYMFYLLLSGFWSVPPDWYRLGQKFALSIYLIGFIAITHAFVSWDRHLYENLLKICVIIAATAALVNLVWFYADHKFPMTRLQGFGSLTNINEFVNVYGVYSLLATSFALRTHDVKQRLLFLLAVVVFLVFAWFGQSRTAFVSMILVQFVLIGLMERQWRILYFAGMSLLVGVILLEFQQVLDHLFVRGEGLRPMIWAEVWKEIMTMPVFGHGIVLAPHVEVKSHHFEGAHNAYLQLFWQGGLVGLGLFGILFAVAFKKAWARGRQQGEFTVFCMLLFAAATMLTGVETLIDRPRDQWMLFWFPLALLIGYQTAAPPASASEQPQT